VIRGLEVTECERRHLENARRLAVIGSLGDEHLFSRYLRPFEFC
jgi:hypothetical protein